MTIDRLQAVSSLLGLFRHSSEKPLLTSKPSEIKYKSDRFCVELKKLCLLIIN